MNLVSFDLEILKELPEGASDWKEHRPLGISCASIYRQVPAHSLFISSPVMSWVDYQHSPQEIVNGLLNIQNTGNTIVTWNGLSFDFDVLAEESGMYKECTELALNHVDLMFIIVTLKGHYLGLDKAAKGMGIQGKLKRVKLNNGSVLNDMSGGKAPGLWKAKEYQAVLDYLADDVRSTWELARAIEKEKCVKWISNRGFEMKIDIPKLYTVTECLTLRRDIPHYITEPVQLKDMMTWIK